MKAFRRTYFPNLKDDKLRKAAYNLQDLKERYNKRKTNNLEFLLRKRYEWMNEYTKGLDNIIEIGSGLGLTKYYVNNPNLKLTDVSDYEWIDQKVDALNMPYENSSLDAIISCHMIHHVAKLKTLFKEFDRVLKPSGLVIISEINTSFMTKFMLGMMKHEGWSYNVDVFDEKTMASQINDPWSANCAIPELLFRNNSIFENQIKNFKIIRNNLCECFLFLLSGGVTSENPTINLKFKTLKMVHEIDKLLIKFFPNIFAMGRQIVIKKK
tara:strand:- start:13445 stop:14248 length:804 start_codon:yes stop_codon:yes gene_type:complete